MMFLGNFKAILVWAGLIPMLMSMWAEFLSMIRKSTTWTAFVITNEGAADLEVSTMTQKDGDEWLSSGG